MPRGGKRQGTPGEAYQNRTDLNSGPRIQAPVGQPYGVAGAQIAAQQAVPMAPPPPPTPLGAPTARPDEPVTAGSSLGAGVGPEAIPSLSPHPGPDPELMNLAQYLPALELLTTLPGASDTTRNFVRRLRGVMPIPEPQTPTEPTDIPT